MKHPLSDQRGENQIWAKQGFFSTFYFSILCFTFMPLRFLKKMKLVHQGLIISSSVGINTIGSPHRDILLTNQVIV